MNRGYIEYEKNSIFCACFNDAPDNKYLNCERQFCKRRLFYSGAKLGPTICNREHVIW